MPGSDAGDGTTSGAPLPREIVERPPPGLAQGRYDWPPWGIAILGGLAVTLGLAFLAHRLRRRVRS